MWLLKYKGPDVRDINIKIDFAAAIGELACGTVGLKSVGEVLDELGKEGCTPESIFQRGLDEALNGEEFIRINHADLMDWGTKTKKPTFPAWSLLQNGFSHADIYNAGVRALAATGKTAAQLEAETPVAPELLAEFEGEERALEELEREVGPIRGA